MKTMKVKEVIELLEEDGWYFYSQKGSHRQFKHPIKKGKVTVAGKRSKTLPVITLLSILKQAGLK
jgi:predicted RNA binding protein YcfA (HicA-like mRNA interferase family)